MNLLFYFVFDMVLIFCDDFEWIFLLLFFWVFVFLRSSLCLGFFFVCRPSI